MLKPAHDCILVELKDQYKHIAITEKKYDTRTQGVCVAVGRDIDQPDLIGKLVFFESYKDDAIVERDDKRFAFIKADYVLGMEDADV